MAPKISLLPPPLTLYYSGPWNDICSFLGYTAEQGQNMGQFSQSLLSNMPRNIISKRKE